MGWHIFRGFLGLGLLIGFCWLLSEKKKSIHWRIVPIGILLQIIFCAIILWVPLIGNMLEAVSVFFIRLLEFSNEGARFVFGKLATDPSYEAVIAFKVLPSIIFISAFTTALYYLGLLQKIVFGFAWLMQHTMKLSGAESFAMAANIFVGQTEAPLMVKPYLKKMTRSEILCLMTGGMATIAGGVMVAYISILGGNDLHRQVIISKHLLTASILSAPAAILCAKLLLPETQPFDHDLKINRESIGYNLFDAISKGTTEGIKLALNVCGILLIFIALIALINYISINWIGSWTGLNAVVIEFTDGRFEGFNLQFIFGLLFAPVAWIIGIDSESLLFIGQLLGEKMVLNEFIAFISLEKMIDEGLLINERTIIITTYALCGFANFGSMGIQIGGIVLLAPNQRRNITTLALRAMTGGMVACLMTACVAGMFIH